MRNLRGRRLHILCSCYAFLYIASLTNESINNSMHDEECIQIQIQFQEKMMKRYELVATGAWCKEHLNDKELPGVCSSCLREKLSQLYNKNPIDPLGYSPSPSSPASPQPFSCATGSSTNHVSSAHRKRFRRNASHAADSASCMLSFNYGLNLKKSKSLAFTSRNRLRERDVSGGRGRKKDGFWSKVLKLKRKDTQESIMNSRA
ncbi:hypothetical protein VNO77_44063 [Canavalia gladiata]|uniref:Uncharacterized protein n=1 Tax=Canavalia gladiata TaxID=3824 RepID=A0AAN9JY90_CANGL